MVEAIATIERLAAIQNEWRSLERATRNVFPFRTPEWTAAWWTHFADDRRALKDSLFVRAVRSPSGELVGIAPLIRTEKPGFGLLRARFLEFVGPDGSITELTGVLCHPEWERAVFQALVEHLRGCAHDWDCIRWTGLRPGDGSQVIEGAGGFTWLESWPNYLLGLSPSWEELHARLPRNLKESLRKCFNSLKRDGLRHELEIARSPEKIAVGLEHFFRLHRERAQMAGTVRHRDFFRAIRAQEFLRDVCRRLAARGAVRLFLLRVEGKIVAARIGFVLEDSLYLYYSGYDPAYGRYSVMTTLLAGAVRSAIEEGLTTVNLSFGKDVSKTRWRPIEIVYWDGIQIAPTRRARVAMGIYKILRRCMHLLGVEYVAAKYLWRW